VKYKDLKGDMLVPQTFVVPINDITWPKETWGMKLGSVVSTIRAGKSHGDKREDLESIGFDFNLQRRSCGYEANRAALLKYKELEGNMMVPTKFVVPNNNITWPEETWGTELGRVVMRIRAGKSWKDKREDLESIGFVFSSQQFGYEAIRAALLKYKDLKGNMLVPAKFVVPVNDTTWPEEIRGKNLGNIVISIRAAASHVAKREDLESIGFDYNPQQIRYGYEAIRAALLKYKNFKGDMLVPARFVVPVNDITWPKEIWGMNLGTVVRNTRRGISHVDKRADLKSIGFDFNPQRSGPKVAI
jgi:hypothetical protein